MRNSLLKAVPWVGLTVVALIAWTRQPAPAAEESPATGSAPQQLSPPTAAAPSVVGQKRARSANNAGGPNKAKRGPPLTAEQLTDRAKTQLALDPVAALQDIERADKLAGPQDEMRRVLEIHALVRLGKVSMARTLSDRFYRNFPNSDRAVEIERLTGSRLRPGHP